MEDLPQISPELTANLEPYLLPLSEVVFTLRTPTLERCQTPKEWFDLTRNMISDLGEQFADENYWGDSDSTALNVELCSQFLRKKPELHLKAGSQAYLDEILNLLDKGSVVPEQLFYSVIKEISRRVQISEPIIKNSDITAAEFMQKISQNLIAEPEIYQHSPAWEAVKIDLTNFLDVQQQILLINNRLPAEQMPTPENKILRSQDTAYNKRRALLGLIFPPASGRPAAYN